MTGTEFRFSFTAAVLVESPKQLEESAAIDRSTIAHRKLLNATMTYTKNGLEIATEAEEVLAAEREWRLAQAEVDRISLEISTGRRR